MGRSEACEPWLELRVGREHSGLGVVPDEVPGCICQLALQVPERRVDCLAQLYHSNLRQPHIKSSTYLKVLVNGKLPFVAALHWKDTSRATVWRWEGGCQPWGLFS